jgi:hypothetical protein
MDTVRRSTHRLGRRPRRLADHQVRERLQVALDEITLLGGSYWRTAGEIRHRLLLLERQVRETLDRWPEGLRGESAIRR